VPAGVPAVEPAAAEWPTGAREGEPLHPAVATSNAVPKVTALAIADMGRTPVRIRGPAGRVGVVGTACHPIHALARTMDAMTFEPGGPLARRQAAQARRRGGRGRRWLLAGLILAAGNGGRAWWARRLGDFTNGSHGADFVIGLAVGLLPVITVGIAGLSHGRRRMLRMFVAGACGFVVTDLLAPSVVRALTDNGAATRPFEQHVPGYLPGVYTGVGIWVVLLIVAIVRIRRALHRHVRHYGG
jgi:hypothetical protein